MNCSEAASILLDYKESELFEPDIYWTKCYYYERIYSIWAFEVAVKEILLSDDKDPLAILEDLANRFYDLSEADSKTVSNAFRYAYAAIEDAIDILKTAM